MSLYTLEAGICSGNRNSVNLPWETCFPSVREGCNHSSSDRAYTELCLPSCLCRGSEKLWNQTKCADFTPGLHLATRTDTVPKNPRSSDRNMISAPCLPPSGGGVRLLPSLMSLGKVVKGHPMPLRSLRHRTDTEVRRFWPGQAAQVCFWCSVAIFLTLTCLHVSLFLLELSIQLCT